MLGHTFTQGEKGNFIQVQSSDDLILLALTQRSNELQALLAEWS